MSNGSSSTVLVVLPGDSAGAQIAPWLEADGRRTKVMLSGAGAIEEALAGDYAAMIVEIRGEEDVAHINLLRHAGYLRPIIAIDVAPAARTDECFDRILQRPLEKDEFLRALRTELAPSPIGAQGDIQARLETSTLFSRLRHSFLLELADSVEQVAQAIELEDWENAGHLAHTLKGTAASFGFSELAEASKRIEILLRAGKHPQAQAGLGQLRYNADFLLR